MNILTVSFLILSSLHIAAVHAEEEDAGVAVGPDKGIVEVSEQKGFKLSPEALKNFQITTQKISGKGPWEIPSSAVVRSLEETNVIRVREGYYKSIDFTQVKTGGSSLLIQGSELRDGDQIVLTGLGFLKISEIAATGGAAHGHSH